MFNTNELTNTQNIGGTNEQSSQITSNTFETTINNIPDSSTISTSENTLDSTINKTPESSTISSSENEY